MAVILAAVTIVLTSTSTASAQTTGSQNFRVIFVGAPSNEGLVVATGVVNGVGTAVTPEGQRPTPFPVELVLDGGTLFLTITPTGNALLFDPRRCVLSGPIFGTYQVTGGTGQFEGASGNGQFEGTVFALFPRGSQGECVGPASGELPIFVVQTIDNPGTLTLPARSAA